MGDESHPGPSAASRGVRTVGGVDAAWAAPAARPAARERPRAALGRRVRRLADAALAWLTERPGELARVVRGTPPQDVLIAALAGLAWFTTVALATRWAYWYPSSLGRYWLSGWWLVLVLALRRSAPVGTFWLVVLVFPQVYSVPLLMDLHVAPLLAAAFFAAQVGRPRPGLLLAATVVGVLTMQLGGLVVRDWASKGYWNLFVSDAVIGIVDPSEAATLTVIAVLTCVIGVVTGRLQATRRMLERRNAQLLALQEVRAREAVRTERTRIARELHDVVAHHVSAIVIRAQAADRVADTDPDAPREAVRWIAGAGRESLDAMRSVVRVLRDDESARGNPSPGGAPPETAPARHDEARRAAAQTLQVGLDSWREARTEQIPAVPMRPVPGLDDLPAMIDRVRAAGLEVRAEIDRVPCSQAVELAVVRVAQEALTNVLLHSAAAQAQVRLSATSGGQVRLVVSDDGPARPGEAERTCGGNGLVHMRERAVACGGQVSVGPAGNGWRVELVVPGAAR